MKRLHFSITIDAPARTVWETLIDDASYRDWTSAFSPGSHYEGEWTTGSKIRFVGPDPQTGIESGMVSRVVESRPHAFISIEHQGLVMNGVEDTTSEAARRWAPAFENYTFRDLDGRTELRVELDTPDEGVSMMEQAWPQALERLKVLAEQR